MRLNKLPDARMAGGLFLISIEIFAGFQQDNDPRPKPTELLPGHFPCLAIARVHHIDPLLIEAVQHHEMAQIVL